MPQEKKQSCKQETPVDEVRRIRERFDKEADGDIPKLCEIYKNAAAGYRKKLNLKPVLPPGLQVARDDTKG